MKKKIFSLLILSGIILIGCEREQVETEPDQDVSKQLELVETETLSSGFPTDVNAKSDFTSEFENANTWFAYYTAKTLREDPLSRMIFASKLGTDNTVSAANLLNNSTGINPFRDKFRGYVWQKVCADINCGRPEIPKGGPPPPLNPNGDGGPVMGDPIDINVISMKDGDLGGDGISQANEITDAFIDYITTEACMEIYVPNGLDYSPTASIYAVSHPLNNVDDSNRGYEYYADLVLDDGDDNPGFESGSKVITPALMLAEGNVIVSRPVDIPMVQGCGYSDYFDIADFTLFLNND